MSINAILESLKAFAQALQVATIFPAVLFVLINSTIILPQAGLLSDEQSMAPGGLLLGTTLSLVISYTLYAFNFPLIRFMEGYKQIPKAVWERLRAEKIRKYEKLWQQLSATYHELRTYQFKLGEDSDFEKDPGWQSRYTRFIRNAVEFEHNFPSGQAMVLPTDLGNIVAAFEDYPRTRYGIKTTILWPRLLPILRDTRYIDFVSQEKVVFDFLLNTGFIIVILGIEIICLSIYLHKPAITFLTLAVTLAVSMVFYEGLKQAGQAWGSTVRVAFDRYRHQLSAELGLKPQKTFNKEYKRWQEISDFYMNRMQDFAAFRYFVPESELTPNKKPLGEPVTVSGVPDPDE